MISKLFRWMWKVNSAASTGKAISEGRLLQRIVRKKKFNLLSKLFKL